MRSRGLPRGIMLGTAQTASCDAAEPIHSRCSPVRHTRQDGEDEVALQAPGHCCRGAFLLMLCSCSTFPPQLLHHLQVLWPVQPLQPLICYPARNAAQCRADRISWCQTAWLSQGSARRGHCCTVYAAQDQLVSESVVALRQHKAWVCTLYLYACLSACLCVCVL